MRIYHPAPPLSLSLSLSPFVSSSAIVKRRQCETFNGKTCSACRRNAEASRAMRRNLGDAKESRDDRNGIKWGDASRQQTKGRKKRRRRRRRRKINKQKRKKKERKNRIKAKEHCQRETVPRGENEKRETRQQRNCVAKEIWRKQEK